MAIETEIKLAFEKGFTESEIKSLETVLKSFGYDLAIITKDLENAYFDTPNFDLNKQKMALRVREKVGKEGESVYIQTLKTAGVSVNGLSQRGEWEWALSGSQLDFQVLAGLDVWPASVDVHALVNVFDTNFTRYQTEFSWQGSLVELVLDWGWIVSNGRQERIHEIELELKQGEPAPLVSLSTLLQANLPLRPSDLSKAERGYRLFKN